jgi:hypothetical protein
LRASAQPRWSSLQLARLCSAPLLPAVEHAGVARCDLLHARFDYPCPLWRRSSGSRREIQASSSSSSPSVSGRDSDTELSRAQAATEARRGSRMAEEQGISDHGASSLPRDAGRRRRRGELGRRSTGSRRVRDMVELRDGGAHPAPQLWRWLMFLLRQRRRQGRREAGDATAGRGWLGMARGCVSPTRSVRSGRRWMWRPTRGTERLRRFYIPPLRENER